MGRGEGGSVGWGGCFDPRMGRLEVCFVLREERLGRGAVHEAQGAMVGQ